MSTGPSRLNIRATGERSLAIDGVVDSHTTDELMDQLTALGTAADVVVDLTNVEFIDSSGLRTLLTAHQNLDDASQRLELMGLSESVDRLLEITGLRSHLNVME